MRSNLKTNYNFKRKFPEMTLPSPLERRGLEFLDWERDLDLEFLGKRRTVDMDAVDDVADDDTSLPPESLMNLFIIGVPEFTSCGNPDG